MDLRSEAVSGHEIHLHPNYLGELSLHGSELEETHPRWKVSDDVEIAVGSIFASNDASEHPEVLRTVAVPHSADRRTPLAEPSSNGCVWKTLGVHLRSGSSEITTRFPVAEMRRCSVLKRGLRRPANSIGADHALCDARSARELGALGELALVLRLTQKGSSEVDGPEVIEQE